MHFSLFGPSFLTRLVTQMYFPGDPLLAFDPIYQSIRDERARQRLIAGFELDVTEPGIGARLSLRPGAARARRDPDGGLTVADLTPFQTIGPYFAILPLAGEAVAATASAAGRAIVIEGIVRDGAGAVVPDALIETWQADAGGTARCVRRATSADSRAR